MEILTSIILGAVEGLTEFIPVSSSGHLIIVREWMGLNGNGAFGGLAFDAVLQFSAILAVLVYFWKDILLLIKASLRWLIRKHVVEESERTNRLMLGAIIVGTIPAVLAGLLLETYMEDLFRNIWLVLVALLAGSLLMWWAEKKAKGMIDSEMSIKKGLLIGLYQCLALIPGISRAGATISGGLLLGIERSQATRFSFLLSIPIILGSGLKKFMDLVQTGEFYMIGPDLIIASVVAFVLGLASIHFLIKYLKTHTLKIFIWYRVVLVVVVLSTILF